MRWYFWQLPLNVFKCPTNKYKFNNSPLCSIVALCIKFKFKSLVEGNHFAINIIIIEVIINFLLSIY